MTKYIEKSARTEDEAINLGLNELGLDRDDVSVELIQRAKSGFLGIGSVPAVVKISFEVPDECIMEELKTENKFSTKTEKKDTLDSEKKKPAPIQKASDSIEIDVVSCVSKISSEKDDNPEYAQIRSFLTGLFEHMGVHANIDIGPREGGGIDVRLSGNGMGTIIGRRGETLDAIQHLTNYAVNHGSDKRMHINVDAEGYRSKREDSLVKLAEKMAEKAIKYKRSMALEPMNSYERHVIHTALQNYEGVTTASTGEEPNRRVVVSYVKPESPSSNKPQSREWA